MFHQDVWYGSKMNSTAKSLYDNLTVAFE